MELDDNIYNKIIKLTDEGDKLIENDEILNAIDKYISALKLIPNPKEIWEASTWIYTAVGDAYFLAQNYEESLNYLFKALKCPDGLGNPFIMLRIGQCFFETNNLLKAQQYLLQAYMIDGIEIFEEEDKKYFELIKPIL